MLIRANLSKYYISSDKEAGWLQDGIRTELNKILFLAKALPTANLNCFNSYSSTLTSHNGAIGSSDTMQILLEIGRTAAHRDLSTQGTKQPGSLQEILLCSLSTPSFTPAVIMAPCTALDCRHRRPPLTSAKIPG